MDDTKFEWYETENTERFLPVRARWTGDGIETEEYPGPTVAPSRSATDIAACFPVDAPRIARECGASEEYRVAVLKARIDAVMQKRGCGAVKTYFNSCASVGFQWSAWMRSSVAREGDERRLSGRTPYAEADHGTEVDALEALATFLGVTS